MKSRIRTYQRALCLVAVTASLALVVGIYFLVSAQRSNPRVAAEQKGSDRRTTEGQPFATLNRLRNEIKLTEDGDGTIATRSSLQQIPAGRVPLSQTLHGSIHQTETKSAITSTRSSTSGISGPRVEPAQIGSHDSVKSGPWETHELVRVPQPLLFDPLQHPNSHHSTKLTLPWVNSVPVETLFRFQWILDLQHLLQVTLQPEWPVSLVASDSRYTSTLLNWLIAALVKLNEPLKNVLVVCTDTTLYKSLQQRNITSIYVLPNSIARVEGGNNPQLTKVEIARVTVMRLLNYWGYAVAHYDADAIILKNPQPLFDQHKDSDIVGSAGTFPPKAFQKWGVTICMGMILLRPTNQTELVWNTVSSVSQLYSDQKLMNYALLQMKVAGNPAINYRKETWHGIGEKGLRVTILPMNAVCRHAECNPQHRSEYYIWHGTLKQQSAKLAGLKRVKLWFLKDDWSVNMNDGLKGSQWLQTIAID